MHSPLEIQGRKFSGQQNVRPRGPIRLVMMSNCGRLTPGTCSPDKPDATSSPDAHPQDRTRPAASTRTRPLTDGHSDHYVPPRVVMKDRMIVSRQARCQRMPGTNAAQRLKCHLRVPGINMALTSAPRREDTVNR